MPYLRVSNENDAIHTLQNQLATRVVEDLTRHGVQVKPGLEAANFSERQREKVEEQGAIRLGREGDHLALRVGIGALVDVLQVRRFPAQTRAVIDDLEVDLPVLDVDERHRLRNRGVYRPAVSGNRCVVDNFYRRGCKILC